MLTVAQARELLAALNMSAEDLAAGELVPGWHPRLSDADGDELTSAIGPAEQNADRGADCG
jgi:hypothetical protein